MDPIKIFFLHCDALDHTPDYAVFVELFHRLFGEEVAQVFRTPFASGDIRHLYAQCMDADISKVQITPYDRPVNIDSIKLLVSTERACVWTLGGLLASNQFDRLLDEATHTL